MPAPAALHDRRIRQLEAEGEPHGPDHAQRNPIHTNGKLPSVGAKAPDFKLTGGDLKDVSLADYKGKRKILNIVPSLDTSVCATSTRRFNEAAGKLANTVVLVVSADLPFASKRFCTTEGLQNVVPLSLMRGKNFAKVAPARVVRAKQHSRTA